MKLVLLFIKMSFSYLFWPCFSSLCLFFRGLITCGRCLCCLSRTSPITSASPFLWVYLPKYEAPPDTVFSVIDWLKFFVCVHSHCEQLMIFFISSCFALTEWSNLCHWRKNLIILRLPFYLPKQLHVRRKTTCPSALTVHSLFLCRTICMLFWWDRALFHYCILL